MTTHESIAISDGFTLNKQLKIRDSIQPPYTSYWFKLIPFASHECLALLLTSSSNPLNGRSARYTRCVSAPKPLKIPANSTAIYPAPKMTIFLGKDSSSKALSLVIVCSAPGIGNFVAFPPVVIKIFRAWQHHQGKTLLQQG